MSTLQLNGYRIEGGTEEARLGTYSAVELADGAGVELVQLRASDRTAAIVARVRWKYSVIQDLHAEQLEGIKHILDAPGGPVLVFEHDGSPSLERLLAQAPPAAALIFGVGLAAARGLEALHTAGLVHGDMCPANIRVEPDGVRLARPGLWDLRFDQGWPASDPEVARSILPYLAPERTGRIDRTADHRADLYGLGTVLYEMMTGAPPFVGAEALEVVHGHLARAPRSPESARPELHPILAEIVLRLLAKEPDERYQTAFGLRRDLERAQARSVGDRAFELGRDDRERRLRDGGQLRGRGAELAALNAAFETIRRGAPPLWVWMTGETGLGKSRLAAAMRPATTRKNGAYLTCRFQAQHTESRPFETLFLAVRGRIRQLLSLTEIWVTAWRERLVALLDADIPLLVGRVPELAHLLDSAAAVPSHGASDTHLAAALQRLIQAIARPDEPLVLHADNLHLADAASLSVLEALLTAPSAHSMLLLGTSGGGEDRLERLAERLTQHGAPPQRLMIGPLTDEAITEIVADTLGLSVERSAELGALVSSKTGGNPFFARQFLQRLLQDDALVFDRQQGWSWCIEDVRARHVTENVAELMHLRLARQRPAVRELLQKAACLGERIDPAQLEPLLGLPAEQLVGRLRPLVDAGLLVQDGSLFAFAHVRAWATAYDQLDPEHRIQTHLDLARLLRDQPGGASVEQQLAQQYHKGWQALTDADERTDVAQLLEKTARRARRLGNFDTAKTYLTTAETLLDLLPTRPQPLVARVATGLARLRWLAGDRDTAEHGLQLALLSLTERLERARVLDELLVLGTAAGRHEQALELAHQALVLLDHEPPPPSRLSFQPLDEGQLEALLTQPSDADPTLQLVSRLLDHAAQAAYWCDRHRFEALVDQGIGLLLEHGSLEAAPALLALHAYVCATIGGRHRAALPQAQFALRLAHARGDTDHKPLVLHILGCRLLPWLRPLREVLPMVTEGLTLARRGGEPLFINYHSLWQNAVLPFLLGHPLPVLRVGLRTLTANAGVGQEPVASALVQGFVAFVDCLEGADDALVSRPLTTRNPLDTDLPRYAQLGMRAMVQTLLGDPGAALETLEALPPHAGRMGGELLTTEVAFFTALALAAVAGRTHEAQSRHRDRLAELEVIFEGLSHDCPDNFEHRLQSIRAEQARLGGRPYEAAALYDKAIATALRGGFQRDAAIAQELAGRLYRAQGRDAFARAYLSEARDGFQQYGATAKVEQMQQRHGDLLASATWASAAAASLELVGSAQSLDQWAITEACHALSGEMVPERLLERLTRLVLTGSGAQRCVILLDDPSRTLRVEADAHIDGDVQRPDGGAVPMDLLRYTRRTGAAILIPDARQNEQYGHADYFRDAEVRSVFCTPIDKAGKPVGVLYLENTLTAGAFDTLDTEFLRLLTAQFAISLETARLYQALRAEIEERERAQQEVSSLNRHLVRKNQELETILYVTSHDLRTPLVTIGGFTHELAGTLEQLQGVVSKHGLLPEAAPLAEEIDEALSCIGRGVHRMDTLLNAVSQIGGLGRVPIDPRTVDMAQLATELRAELSATIGAVEGELEIGALPSCVADPARTRELLFNLLDNAFRHTGHAPRVHLGGRRRGREVIYAISDNGPGIEPAWRERIFDLFQAAGPAAGQGLGLTVARRIAGHHDGRLWVESDPGHGATFYLSLPAAPD